MISKRTNDTKTVEPEVVTEETVETMVDWLTGYQEGDAVCRPCIIAVVPAFYAETLVDGGDGNLASTLVNMAEQDEQDLTPEIVAKELDRVKGMASPSMRTALISHDVLAQNFQEDE